MHTKNIASGIINNAKTFRTNVTCKGVHLRETEVMKIHFSLFSARVNWIVSYTHLIVAVLYFTS